MTTGKKDDDFELVQTSRGPRRIYKRDPSDFIHNFTAEGLASDFGKTPAKAAAGSTGKPEKAGKR